MILDYTLMFSDSQSIAMAAGSALSTKSVNLGSLTEVNSKGDTVITDIGRSGVDLFVQIVEAVTAGGGAATVTFELVQADNAALTTNLEVLQSSGAISKASLTVGKQIPLSLPVGITKQYLGLRYTVATNTTDTGKVTAGLIPSKNARPTNPTV